MDEDYILKLARFIFNSLKSRSKEKVIIHIMSNISDPEYLERLKKYKSAKFNVR